VGGGSKTGTDSCAHSSQRKIYSTHRVRRQVVLFDTAQRAAAALAAAPGAGKLAESPAGVLPNVVRLAAAVCVLTCVAKAAARARGKHVPPHGIVFHLLVAGAAQVKIDVAVGKAVMFCSCATKVCVVARGAPAAPSLARFARLTSKVRVRAGVAAASKRRAAVERFDAIS
jgi:hypothetical protein